MRILSNKNFKSLLFHFVSIGSFIFAWEMFYRCGIEWMKLFPPPTVFLHSLVESKFKIGLGSQAASITTSIFSSVIRVVAGLFISMLSAIILGTLFSLNNIAKQICLPLVRLFAPIAPIAWIPLALVLFGIGDQTAIFIVFMGVNFILTIATVSAIECVSPRLIQTAQVFGANKFQIFIHVIIPAILPSVFTSLRLNFLAAWMAVLAAEMTGLQDGLGAIIMTGRNLFNNEMIISGMFFIGIVGFLFDVILKYIQNRFLWWDKI